MPFDPPSSLPQRRLKLDFAEPPKPKAVTTEGFRDYEGIASIYDTILDYPLEAPAVRQWRPAAALDEAALASGTLKPIVNSHPRVKGVRVWVDPRNASRFSRGVIRSLRLVEGDDGKPELHVEFRVYDQALMDDIDAGKVDLSIGYDCNTVVRSGVTPTGERYDAVQEGPIVINHLAVEYRGRNPGARIKADGQDDISMDEIIALINGGTLTVEQLQQLLDAAMAAKATLGVTDAAPPAGGGAAAGDANKALESRIVALEAAMKSKKADAAEVDVNAIAEKVTKAAAGKLQNLAAARELATPVLGRIKADGYDDVSALYRDVVIEVQPEMKAEAEALYKSGEAVALASLARASKATFNKKLTTDAADNLGNARDVAPKDRKAARDAARDRLAAEDTEGTRN